MFGEKIKTFAKKKFGSLTNLCEKIEMPTQQMWAYTSENSKPSYDVLVRLYQAGCDLNWLVDENKPINEFFDNEMKENTEEYFTPEQVEAIKGIFEAFKFKLNGK
ncbi:MAG: helix-turn-helix domain-containing protein [Fibromonadaceae bacterium]|nr:helix-turn-helix domain-containing protein [Fibromonadaceae bacterium]